PRTVFDLKEDALGLLAVAPRNLLQLVGHGERIAGHRLALLDALDQLSAYRLDLFRRYFVLANNGFRRQFADLGCPVAMLDIVRHRHRRRDHPWRERTRLVDRRPASELRFDF